MMMAHDSSRDPDALNEAIRTSVRAALLAYVDEPANGERLRQALHAVAIEAREQSMPPEHMLIVLKDIWYSLPSVRALREPADQARLLQRVVTMCIKEYYTSH